MSIRIKDRLIEVACFVAIAMVPAAVYAGDAFGQYLAPIIAGI
tara:strand:+ start:653 stop:781 length:129 start_codon:yes stop_codon:yes gene_type:complete